MMRIQFTLFSYVILYEHSFWDKKTGKDFLQVPPSFTIFASYCGCVFNTINQEQFVSMVSKKIWQKVEGRESQAKACRPQGPLN
jgi:hypothetical protein